MKFAAPSVSLNGPTAQKQWSITKVEPAKIVSQPWRDFCHKRSICWAICNPKEHSQGTWTRQNNGNNGFSENLDRNKTVVSIPLSFYFLPFGYDSHYRSANIKRAPVIAWTWKNQPWNHLYIYNLIRWPHSKLWKSKWLQSILFTSWLSVLVSSQKYVLGTKWRCPEIGVPLNHPFIDGIFL